MIKNKRILITGGGGSVGSELVKQLARYNRIFILDNNETAAFDLTEELKLKGFNVNCRIGDIRNNETVREVFSKFNPQIVFHAAAYKHVTPMEDSPSEAVETNILGLINVIKASRGKFVFISSDKAIQHNSIMGATKRVGEIITKNAGGIAVRFGNVLGSRGSVIPIWQAQIERGEPITVTDAKMERYFMTIEEACQLVIKAAQIGKGGELVILDMGKPINILELAKQIIKESGKDIGIKMIGIRPGETLSEKLMTDEEERVAVCKGEFIIVK